MKCPNFLGVAILLIVAITILGCTGPQAAPGGQQQGSDTPVSTKSPAASGPQADTVGFSRNHPAPIGTTVTDDFEITEHDSNTGKFSYIKAKENITILEVKRGYDAIRPMVSKDFQKYVDQYQNDEKYRGYEPILIKVRYGLVSIDKDLGDAWQCTYWDFGLVAGDGTVYDDPGGVTGGLLTFIDVKKLWLETYAPSSMDGYVLGFVHTDDPAPLLKYNVHNSPLWFKTV